MCVRDYSYACIYTQGLGTPTASQHNVFDSENLSQFHIVLIHLTQAGFEPIFWIFWSWIRCSTNWATPSPTEPPCLPQVPMMDKFFERHVCSTGQECTSSKTPIGQITGSCHVDWTFVFCKKKNPQWAWQSVHFISWLFPGVMLSVVIVWCCIVAIGQ